MKTKTFRCLVRANRWSFETDSNIVISPTGVQVESPAHHYKLKSLPESKIVADVIIRSYHATEKEKAGVHEYAVMHLTRAEMLAFKVCRDTCRRK